MWLSRVLRAGEDRPRRGVERLAARVSDVAPIAERLSSEELASTAVLLRDRSRRGSDGESLLVEMLARVAEAARRDLGLEARGCQLQAAIAMCRGFVVELPTGEGKTLAAAMAAAALAVEGAGVHVLTTNPYLADRDFQWMRGTLAAVGLSVGCVTGGEDRDTKRSAYSANVTYSTHLEVGFDLLRDGFVGHPDHRVARPGGFLLLDEADSVLIDEARIPMVVSGPDRDLGGLPYWAAWVVEQLEPDVDFEVDPARRMAWVTDRGVASLDALTTLELFSDGSGGALRAVMHALRARAVYRRNRDYIVDDAGVHIVDEYTGHAVPGRRWSDGLHQAIEAKERLRLSQPRRTYALLTVRSLLAQYRQVSGMTATVSEVAKELRDHYELESIVLGPYRPSIRLDAPDRCYESAQHKLDAALAEIVTRHERGQPLLVGCDTVAATRHVAHELAQRGVTAVTLNATNDREEARVIARAGKPGAVTVATHVAGRGVDIPLGGEHDHSARSAAVRNGGLCVIGTERFESPRLERQLRGRAGRQGDPGESVFFVSIDDPITREWLPRSGGDVYQRLAAAQQNLGTRNAALRSDALSFGAVFEQHRLAALQHREVHLATADQDALARHDKRWVDHLQALLDLVDVTHFRAWAAESPLAAWHRETRQLLTELLTDEHEEDARPAPTSEPWFDAAEWLSRLGPPQEEPEPQPQQRHLPHLARAVTSFNPEFGAGVMLDVIAVSDIDGTRVIAHPNGQ